MYKREDVSPPMDLKFYPSKHADTAKKTASKSLGERTRDFAMQVDTDNSRRAKVSSAAREPFSKKPWLSQPSSQLKEHLEDEALNKYI